jgi:plastocyanin
MFLAPVLLAVSSALINHDRTGDEPPLPGTGDVVGRVTFEGTPPPRVLNPEAATRRSPVEVDPESLGLLEAAAWIDGVPRDDRPEAPDPETLEPIEVDQLNYEFIPRVVTVEAGRPVAFLNNDIANHGVTALGASADNSFNVTTPTGGRYTHRFVPSRRPVALGCPIHVAMSAWIFVFDHPWHAVTDDRGRFRISGVPAGRRTLFVHHPAGGLRRRVEVDVPDGETTSVEISFAEEDLAPASGDR